MNKQELEQKLETLMRSNYHEDADGRYCSFYIKDIEELLSDQRKEIIEDLKTINDEEFREGFDEAHLLSYKQELIEKIEKKKHLNIERFSDDSILLSSGYNKALREIINLIKDNEQ